MILLAIASWLPLLNPGQWWLSGFAGLLFPILWGLNIFFLLYWIIRRSPFYWFSIAGLLLSTRAMILTFGMHATGAPATPKPGHFTIMTFNTSSMGLKWYKEDSTIKRSIYNTLTTASPDILCMQEFYTNSGPGHTDHIAGIQGLNYPYHYFTRDQTRWKTWQYGIVLFSRYPIINACQIPCGNSPVGSGSTILQADINVNGRTIRVLTAQLQSYMFKNRDYAVLQGGSRHGRGLAGKMKHTFSKRAAQADLLASLLRESPYPTIICGDFNDTPVSYTYNTVAANMQDAFLEQGWGIGRTLSFLAPTLRIDYILAQPAFHIHGYSTFPHKGFEHFPVMASLSL